MKCKRVINVNACFVEREVLLAAQENPSDDLQNDNTPGANDDNNNNDVTYSDTATTVIDIQGSEISEQDTRLNSEIAPELGNLKVTHASSSSVNPEHYVIDMIEDLCHKTENSIRDEPCPISPTKAFDILSSSEPTCRVCQCNDENEKLISPCDCSGSVKWVHESCLIKWLKCSLKDSCELCRKYIGIQKRRKPFSKWTLPSQRPTPVLWVLVFVTAIALNLASVVKDASRLCSSTPCLVFYAVGCVGVILGTLFLIYWSKRARNFINHWLELNEEWIILENGNGTGNPGNGTGNPGNLTKSCDDNVTTKA